MSYYFNVIGGRGAESLVQTVVLIAHVACSVSRAFKPFIWQPIGFFAQYLSSPLTLLLILTHQYSPRWNHTLNVIFQSIPHSRYPDVLRQDFGPSIAERSFWFVKREHCWLRRTDVLS